MQSLEKRNKRVGLLVAVGVHLLLLIVFVFILAWRAPDPPLPEYGIELNFGLDNVGTGTVQPEQPVENTESEEEAAPEELPEEVVEEVETETTEETVEETTDETEAVDNVQESPDVVPTNEKEETTEEKQPEQPKETKKEVKETETTEKEDGAKGKDGEKDTSQNVNQGDNIDKTGDKGDEKGTLDSRTLYGNPGGGGGSSLEMTGWTWDFKPKPNDTSDENGRIVFEVKIDDQGEILSVRTIERSVSPAVEKIYRAEVEKLTFSKTSDNALVAPISTGKITFVIKSK